MFTTTRVRTLCAVLVCACVSAGSLLAAEPLSITSASGAIVTSDAPLVEIHRPVLSPQGSPGSETGSKPLFAPQRPNGSQNP